MRVRVLLWLTLLLANIGEWIYFIALNLLVLQQTNSALAVSVLYMLIPLAMLATNSWAGSVVDRVNVRTLLLVVNVIRVVLIVAISSSANLYWIYALSFFLQMSNALYSTASFVYIPRVLPAAQLQQFHTWRSMAQSSGFIIGPSIAGVLVALSSAPLAMLVNAGVLLICIGFFCLLPAARSTSEATAISWQHIRQDWQLVIRTSRGIPLIASLFLLFGFFTVLLTSIDSLEVAFAMNTLQLSEARYGMLVSIAGLGFVVGSIIQMKWPPTPLRALIGGIIMTAIGYALYGLSTSFFSAACGFFLLSAALTFANVGYSTYIQQAVAPEQLGRFMSMFSMVEALLMLCSIPLFGLLAESSAIRSSILIGTALLFAVAAAMLWAKHRL